MSDTAADLAVRAKQLPRAEREQLVDALLESLNEPATAELDVAWNAEIERRLAAYDRGEVQALSAERLRQSARYREVTAIRFLPEAEAELLHEVEYYSQARAGTGIRFQAAIEVSLQRASRHPLGGAPSHQGTRSLLVKGFPFSVIYRASETELLVVAIAPHRRRPGYWLARISDGKPLERTRKD